MDSELQNLKKQKTNVFNNSASSQNTPSSSVDQKLINQGEFLVQSWTNMPLW